MAIDIKKIGQDIITLIQKGEALIEKEIPIGEKIVNAVLPTLPVLEKDLAAAIAAATEGQDITAIEDALAFVMQLKATIALAKAAI